MKWISTEELRQLHGHEGLILQGCGGELQDWVDGIHTLLREEKILQNEETFQQIYAFSHDGSTCLLFDFDGVRLDVGRLAMWRLRTHEVFGGTWLSDFLSNQLGMTEEAEPQSDKPDCALIGQNGNLFNLIGIAARTLRENHLEEQAKEMTDRILRTAKSYDHALAIIGEYVNVVAPQEEMEMENF